MTFWELAGIVFGILFIVVAMIGLCLFLESNRDALMKKRIEEKQRIEQMEEENRLLKAKCSVGTLTWQMEQAK